MGDALMSATVTELTADELVQVLLDMSNAALTTPNRDLAPEEDEAATEFAERAVEAAGHSVEYQARAHIQCGICHWTKGRFEEGAESFRAAKALNQANVWTTEDDVMLWHCERRVDRALAEEEKKEKEKDPDWEPEGEGRSFSSE